jgi:DNA polymerase-3 subunit epsilon
VLTGITEAMVARAPRLHQVLPSLLEFVGDAVVVGHNVRFDVGFLQAALEREGRPPLANPTVDTVALARRLLRDEVPNCRLGTLAQQLRLPHRPTHRALDDALATADLLHVLLERAGSWGVAGLDDLASLPALANHPQADKLRLTASLPRSPGIYLFRDRSGRVLYVGKATNLRSRVRSYFSTDERRKVGALLRDTARIDHKVCPSTLEAAVLEARLIRCLTPPYNSQGTRWQRYPYVKLTLGERYPRLSVVRSVRDDGGLYLGPLPSAAMANRVVEAIESVVPLRRCRRPVGREPSRSAPCAAAQLGVSTCPCAGGVDPRTYDAHVRVVVDALRGRPDQLVQPLAARMARLAAEERYEEAALTRDRLAALTGALRRQRRLEQLVRCERLVLTVDSGERAELRRGVLWRMWAPPDERSPDLWGGPGDDDAGARDVEMQPEAPPPAVGAVARDVADELACVGAWLDRHAGRVRIELVEGVMASPLPALPRFEPARPRGASRRPRR